MWMDRTSLQVISRLRSAGVESILLKGPSTARWLYGPGERSYVDLDVLIDRANAARADAVLRELGYVDPRDGALPEELDDHSWTYRPTGGLDGLRGEIDLHYSLNGVPVPPLVVWEELSKHTAPLSLADGVVPALDEVGRALVLVLHAGRDVLRKRQSFEDLRRLVKALPEQTWPEVVALATRLEALEPFAVGLMLLEDGRARLARLGVPEPALITSLLYRPDVPVTAHRVQQLVSERGVRAKARLAWRELWPTEVWLRWWSEEAGFAADSLPRLRLRRMRHVVSATPAALSGWRRVRRAARG
jgi:hypothetical protein